MKNKTNNNPAANVMASTELNGKIAVIQANWHSEIVTQATKSFIDDLTISGMDEDNIDIFDVPGSLEIPLQAKKLLEKKVSEKTKELQSKVYELEKFNKLTVGRELRMVELKKKIRRLERQLGAE